MPVQIDIKSLVESLKKDRKKMLIACGAVACAALAAYFTLLLRPQAASLFTTMAKVGRMKADLKKAESDVAGIDKLKASIQSYSEKMESYGALLPTEGQMPALLESLSEMARGSGMKISGLAPVQEPAAAPGSRTYRPIPITINARAGFHELGKFLASVESSGRFMKISDISIRTNRASPRKHDVDLVVTAYVLTGGA
jgi:type IV pilus assembly protein PilO